MHNRNIYIRTLQRSDLLGAEYRRVSSSLGCIIKPLDICPPLPFVGSDQSPVVRKEAIDFSLDIGCLSPHASAACESPNLILEFTQQDMAAIVPRFKRHVDLICLVDRVDGFRHIPKTNSNFSTPDSSFYRYHLLVQRHVGPNTSKLSLEANATGVVRTRFDRVKGRAALGIRIMMIILSR